MGNRAWTEAEIRTLKEEYPTGDTNIIAQKLGRTAHAVRLRAIREGVNKIETEYFKVGDVIHYLKVIGPPFLKKTGKSRYGYKHFPVRCRCGKELSVRVDCLRNGDSKSCGCYNRTVGGERLLRATVKTHDIYVGFSCGRWTVVGEARRDDSGERRRGRGMVALCRCSCGTERSVPLTFLRRGLTLSCGCLRKETCGNLARKHGMSQSAIYENWCAMKARCYNPNKEGYENYGERGISVCDEWMSFEPFHEWSLANGCAKGLTIDRIDNDGNYEPANCRWGDGVVQGNNKRNNRRVEAWGEVKTVANWARDERCVVGEACLRNRLKRGWSMENALTTPVRRNNVNSN